MTWVILSLALLFFLQEYIQLLPTRRELAEKLWPIFAFFTKNLKVLMDYLQSPIHSAYLLALPSPWKPATNILSSMGYPDLSSLPQPTVHLFYLPHRELKLTYWKIFKATKIFFFINRPYEPIWKQEKTCNAMNSSYRAVYKPMFYNRMWPIRLGYVFSKWDS